MLAEIHFKGQNNMENMNDIKKELDSLYSKRNKIQYELDDYYDAEMLSQEQYENEVNQDYFKFSEPESMINDLDIVDEKILSLERKVFEIEQKDYFMNNRNRFKKGTSISDLKTSRDLINRKIYAKVLSE